MMKNKRGDMQFWLLLVLAVIALIVILWIGIGISKTMVGGSG